MLSPDTSSTLELPGQRQFLFAAGAKPFLRENQIPLALKDFRRGVVVAWKRFFQTGGPFPGVHRQLSAYHN
jgi:hypothetical protein